MRFKCVCKSWLHLFSDDSDFITLYSRRNGTHGFIRILSSYTDDDDDFVKEKDELDDVIKSNGVVFCNIDKKETKVFQFTPETGLFNRHLRIRDSLNGLVLLSLKEDNFCLSHHVFNPITGHSVKLPDLKFHRYNSISGKAYFHLAYDAAIEKYKVICYYKLKKYRVFKIVTVDGESNSWRNVVAALSDPCLNVHKQAVFANGCLNWLTHDRYGGGGCKADQGKILSLDVTEEKCYAIDYPKGVSNACTLLEMGGSLCFFDYVSTRKIKLWVLKENEGKQSKRDQHNEWVEIDVDIMQNNNVPEGLFNNFRNYDCLGIVKNPSLKILLLTTITRVLDEPDERGFITHYIPAIYSYDVELKTFDLVCEHGGRIFVKWDLSSLLHFQSTVAGSNRVRTTTVNGSRSMQAEPPSLFSAVQ